MNPLARDVGRMAARRVVVGDETERVRADVRRGCDVEADGKPLEGLDVERHGIAPCARAWSQRHVTAAAERHLLVGARGDRRALARHADEGR